MNLRVSDILLRTGLCGVVVYVGWSAALFLAAYQRPVSVQKSVEPVEVPSMPFLMVGEGHWEICGWDWSFRSHVDQELTRPEFEKSATAPKEILNEEQELVELLCMIGAEVTSESEQRSRYDLASDGYWLTVLTGKSRGETWISDMAVGFREHGGTDGPHWRTMHLARRGNTAADNKTPFLPLPPDSRSVAVRFDAQRVKLAELVYAPRSLRSWCPELLVDGYRQRDSGENPPTFFSTPTGGCVSVLEKRSGDGFIWLICRQND